MADETLKRALERFESLIERAQQLDIDEPTAATLATAGPDGRPAARVVLLRGFDERGFVFFTNSNSQKGRHIAANPHVSLCFYWDALKEQVRIAGRAAAVADEESDAYWKTRPRDSQFAAWASLQSEPLDSRHTLENRFAEFEQKYADADVPRPAHWHGYRVTPERIEFWQNRPSRLHDRLVYELRDGTWTVFRLYP